MSVLTKDEILKQIKKGNVKITHFRKENVGPATIDLTLDNKFRVFKKGSKVRVTEAAEYEKVTNLVTKESILLKKGEMITGITKEKISLPENICGLLHGRSRFARMGLMVHVSSAFLQPGVSNQQVLEIVNLGGRDLELVAGTKICQVMLIKTIGSAKYAGRYKDQKMP